LESRTPANTTRADIHALTDEFSEKVDSPLPNLDKIQQIFAKASSVEQIFDNLDGEASEWSQKLLKNCKRHSPMSMKVVFE
jgi:hypothetical protein